MKKFTIESILPNGDKVITLLVAYSAISAYNRLNKIYGAGLKSKLI